MSRKGNVLICAIGLALGAVLVYLGTLQDSICPCLTGGPCANFCITQQQLYFLLIGVSFIILSIAGLATTLHHFTWLDKKPTEG